MNILVTGGAGFIGSHLSECLLFNGDNVTVLDNLSSGKVSNIPDKCNFILGDINDTELLAKVFEKVDICYHLAAIPSVQKSIENWIACHNVNLVGTVNIFLASRVRAVPVVYASSAAVYGDTKVLPISETSNINPKSPYGLDKYYCELQAKAVADIYGAKTLGLRFFNVYGPRQDPHSSYSGVISIFVERIKHSKPLDVFGDGYQERDFIFIDDVVRALILAKDNVSNEAKIYNICTGSGCSVNFLIDTLFDVFEKKVAINYLNPRLEDVYKSIGSSKEAQKELGFKATYSLKDGLKALTRSL